MLSLCLPCLPLPPSITPSPRPCLYHPCLHLLPFPHRPCLLPLPCLNHPCLPTFSLSSPFPFLLRSHLNTPRPCLFHPSLPLPLVFFSSLFPALPLSPLSSPLSSSPPLSYHHYLPFPVTLSSLPFSSPFL